MYNVLSDGDARTGLIQEKLKIRTTVFTLC